MILKTLRRKLYIRKRMPLQTTTAVCWALGFAMRGTFRAREMAAKDRMPSAAKKERTTSQHT